MRYAIFPVLVIAASFAASVAVEAKEWKRQGSVTTQKGTYSTQGSGACVGQACNRSGSTTGPNGKSVTTSGSVAKTDTGATGQRSIAGPNGKSANSATTVTRTDTGATVTKQVTGPNGGTATRNGTITVTPSTN